MKKYLLAIMVLLSAVTGMNAYPVLYLRGSYGGSDWPANDNTKMTEEDGVYTITVRNFSGEFKIADGNWGDDQYGNNGSQVQLGQPYQCEKGSSHGNISIAATLPKNLVFTFEYDTRTLTVTELPDVPTAYMVGNINDTGWSEGRTDFPLVKEENSCAYVGTYEITSQSWVKFKYENDIYSTGGEDVNIVSGEYYTASRSGNAYVLTPGTWHIYIAPGPESGQLRVAMLKDDYPTQLYILGYVAQTKNGAITDWDPSTGVEMERVAGTSIYIARDVKFGLYELSPGNFTQHSYFSFSENLSSNWDGLGLRFGADSKDKVVDFGDGIIITSGMVPGGGGTFSFCIEPGVYDIAVDMSTMTMTISEEVLINGKTRLDKQVGKNIFTGRGTIVNASLMLEIGDETAGSLKPTGTAVLNDTFKCEKDDGEDISFDIEDCIAGVYDVVFNADEMTLKITKATDLTEISSLAEMVAGNEKFVKFVGTAVCEFNYIHPDLSGLLYLGQDGARGEYFELVPQYAGFDNDLIYPATFNRGNSLTRFEVYNMGSDGYRIVGFDLITIPNGAGQAVQSPMIGRATGESIVIPQLTSIDPQYINKVVQFVGKINTLTMTLTLADNTVITLSNEFTNNVMPRSKFATGDDSLTEWGYGEELPAMVDVQGHVAGVLTGTGGNYNLAVTSISNDVITGVESVDTDADATVDVYNMQGVRVRRDVKRSQALQNLPAGLYIVGGKKVIVR